MTRKEKMAFKRQTRAILENAYNDVNHYFEWEIPGVRRREVDIVKFHEYRDKRFDKAATQVSDLASNDPDTNNSSSNPPSQGDTT